MGDISTDSDLTDVDNNTVCCKCIRVSRDRSYQKALKAACEQLEAGNDVQLVPEPKNLFNTITQDCIMNAITKFSHNISEYFP